ncbi:hypothetical protein JOM56_015702 [Amanita muscaria]
MVFNPLSFNQYGERSRHGPNPDYFRVGNSGGTVELRNYTGLVELVSLAACKNIPSLFTDGTQEYQYQRSLPGVVPSKILMLALLGEVVACRQERYYQETHLAQGTRFVKTGVINPRKERDVLTIPMNYKWAQECGLRKPAIWTISDAMNAWGRLTSSTPKGEDCTLAPA